ncbi:MAG TPA: hypothetical protein VFU32_05595 [Ktedonobacterales bacterium]|nr:hypothetical protein [Ktedonobacterales bacterium]
MTRQSIPAFGRNVKRAQIGGQGNGKIRRRDGAWRLKIAAPGLRATKSAYAD